MLSCRIGSGMQFSSRTISKLRWNSNAPTALASPPTIWLFRRFSNDVSVRHFTRIESNETMGTGVRARVHARVHTRTRGFLCWARHEHAMSRRRPGESKRDNRYSVCALEGGGLHDLGRFIILYYDAFPFLLSGFHFVVSSSFSNKPVESELKFSSSWDSPNIRLTRKWCKNLLSIQFNALYIYIYIYGIIIYLHYIKQKYCIYIL